MLSIAMFCGFLMAIAAQRLLELRVSRKHEVWILEHGGHEAGNAQYKYMVAMHALWFVSMVAEVVLFRRPFVPALAALSFFFVLLGQFLRIDGRKRLGVRWSVKIFVLPDSPVVSDGIYRYIRHPIYLGVAIELAAIPLLHTAYLTAIVFSLLNAIFLAFRISAEERALSLHSNYQSIFDKRGRFAPW